MDQQASSYRPTQYAQQAPQPQLVQQIQPPVSRKIRSDEIVKDSRIFGLDKNIIIMVTVAGLSLGISMYLLRELKKVKETVKSSMTQQLDDDIIEKVEQNSESLKAMEIKFDQLILALSSRERAEKERLDTEQRAKMQQQQILQQQQMLASQQVLQQRQMMASQGNVVLEHQTVPPQVLEKEYQNQTVHGNGYAQNNQGYYQQGYQSSDQNQQNYQQSSDQNQQNYQQSSDQNQQNYQEPIQIPVMGGRLQGTAIPVSDDPGLTKI